MPPPPQPIASMVRRRTRIASGRAPAKRWRRVRAKRKRRTLNKIASKDTGRNCGREMKRTRGHKGGIRPRAVVVTVTLAVWPEVIAGGATEQCVAAAGREQERFTGAEKPPIPKTRMTFINVAVWPAVTPAAAGPGVETEKSGGPVTLKFKEFEFPPG